MSDIGQKIKHEVLMVAAGNPDFIYPNDYGTCLYVRDGEPSCLVGHALWRLGLIGQDLEFRSWNEERISELIDWLDLDLDGDEVAWLAKVQRRQDMHEPWGHAVGIS